MSQTDRERMVEEERLFAARQRQAVRVIAGAAEDVDDCRTLLAMLGLDGDIAASARRERAAAPSGGPSHSAAA